MDVEQIPDMDYEFDRIWKYLSYKGLVGQIQTDDYQKCRKQWGEISRWARDPALFIMVNATILSTKVGAE